MDERRRRALHRAAAETWGEEAADTLVELVVPSGHELATRQDVAELRAELVAMDQRWTGRLAGMDERLTAMDERWEGRFAAMDERLTAMDERWEGRLGRLQEQLEAMEHRLTATFERRIADAVSTQTRTLVFSQLGALVVIAALAFGLR